MEFLSPWIALLAAAIALPLLLLLYFLKLRRQTLRIPSTLLWRKSFEDLQVNAPFQRLRWSLLLVLQLLMLAALLGALSEPLWRRGGATAARIVLLIDRSASMNAPTLIAPDDPATPTPAPTRLDAAKAAALDIIDTLGERGGPTQVMLIAFAASPQVLSAFEINRGVLRDAVNAIASTDEQANLAAALELASAFAGSSDESLDAAAAPQVLLLSDGNVKPFADDAPFGLRGGEFRFQQVAGDPAEPAAQAVDNLGIVALGARRDYDDPARVIVFARLLNAAAADIDAVITASIDGAPAATIRARVPAAAAAPGEASISHALDLPGRGVITLQHNHADDLAADDVAAIVMPAPSAPRVAYVVPDDTPPDPYLFELVGALELRSLNTITREQWLQLDPVEIDSGERFDLVVFDRASGMRLPGVPSISFGGVPAGIEALPERDAGIGHAILSWDRQHPVMRNLSLDSIAFSAFGGLSLPESIATPLAWGPDGPIIAVVRTRGARHVVVGFAMIKSNWPLHVSSAMFLQNALEFLTLAGGSAGTVAGGTPVGSGGGIAHRPGDAITVRPERGAQAITLEGPEGSLATAVTDAVIPVTLPPIRRAGIYAARGAQPPGDVLAVSILSDVESDIRPQATIRVNGESVALRSSARDKPLPLWPWLLGAALALAVLEWLVYCRRVW